MLQVGIIGASGFTGAELLRLVAGHPELELAFATGDSQAGVAARDLYPGLAGAYPDLVYEPFDLDRARTADIVFLGLPHEASMAMAPQLVGHVQCVVDLSAAYRLRDPSLYPTYYGFEHDQVGLLDDAVFGLPELHRAALKGAGLVATPGCHVTTAVLALHPLLDAGLIEPVGITIATMTGITGAGRAPTSTNMFSSVDSNVEAYGLLRHRHTPEIEQELGGAQVLFTPHLVPMSRGLLATCHARPAVGRTLSTDTVIDALRARWADEPFIVVTDGSPSTKATLGSNAVHVTARYDDRTDTVLAIAALDNLTKGASGGAVQAANVALGLDETAGLTAIGLAP